MGFQEERYRLAIFANRAKTPLRIRFDWLAQGHAEREVMIHHRECLLRRSRNRHFAIHAEENERRRKLGARNRHPLTDIVCVDNVEIDLAAILFGDRDVPDPSLRKGLARALKEQLDRGQNLVIGENDFS